MTTNESDISVIITAKNSPSFLKRLLEALRWQTSQPYEIIVIRTSRKNMSDRIIEKYRNYLAIRYFFEPGKWDSFAKNRGVSLAEGSVLAFLDDGCLPHREWVKASARTFNDREEVQALQGDILYGDVGRCLYSEIFNFEYHRWPFHMLDEGFGTLDTLMARNFAVRGELLRKFRMPFDERLKTNEEVELYWKLKQAGITIYFSKNVGICVCQEMNPKSFFASWYSYGIGKGHVRKIHQDFWDHHCAHVYSYIPALRRVCKEISNRRVICHTKGLLRSESSIKALSFFLLSFIQKTAYGIGLVKGHKQKIPGYARPVTPAELHIFLTNKCNLRCSHCYYHSELRKPIREMSVRNLKKIIRSLNRDLRAVYLGGGEPFLNEGIVDMCCALSGQIHVKEIYVSSNGYYTNKILHSMEEVLKKTDCTYTIRISLDGLMDTHNAVRGNPEAFQNAAETIRCLVGLSERETRLKVQIQTTVGNDNLDELDSLAEYVTLEFGVFQSFEIERHSSMFRPNPEFIIPDYGPCDPSGLLAEGQLKNFECRIRDIYKKNLKRNKAINKYNSTYQMMLIRIGVQQALQKRRLICCTAGESIVAIFPDYSVSICEMTKPIGNLTNFDFDLKRLLEDRFGSRIKRFRGECYCTNSCNNGSTIYWHRQKIVSESFPENRLYIKGLSAEKWIPGTEQRRASSRLQM